MPPPRLSFRPLPRLPDASSTTFHQHAIAPGLPHLLPRAIFAALPAIHTWFQPTGSSTITPSSCISTLNPSAWSPHADVLVPLELADPSASRAFRRASAPLGLWTAWATQASAATTPRLTVAQADLVSLPASMQAALALPAGGAPGTLPPPLDGQARPVRANLWLGVAPTVTPLHRDPDGNLLVQLAGRKRVRLLQPALGAAVWQAATQTQTRTMAVGTSGETGWGDGAAAAMRGGGRSSAETPLREGGEEMMQGAALAGLETAVWGEKTEEGEEEEEEEEGKGEGEEVGWEGEIAAGDAVFIPRGWWHAVRGVGEGVTASVNWWFR